MSDNLSAGVRTDLDLLVLEGSRIEDRGDHLIVRSPQNPEFHWGNFIQVTGGDPGDADHWLAVFADAFPAADHVAIGLPELPVEDRYAAHGVELATNDVLTATTLPELRGLPTGYTARPLTEIGDWEQVVVAACADNAATGDHDPASFESFIRAQAASRRALVDRGVAQFVGAFAGDELAADLGIVLLDELARYQSVGTREAHRRQGLAGHLLGLAARWAGDRGAREWVIVTESTNPAGRLYRSLGFAESRPSVTAYRSEMHSR